MEIVTYLEMIHGIKNTEETMFEGTTTSRQYLLNNNPKKTLG